MVSELDKPEIYRRVLESLQTGIYLVDQTQKILFWNDGAERITGHLRQDVLGRFCVEDLLGNRDGHDSFATDAADAIGRFCATVNRWPLMCRSVTRKGIVYW